MRFFFTSCKKPHLGKIIPVFSYICNIKRLAGSSAPGVQAFQNPRSSDPRRAGFSESEVLSNQNDMDASGMAREARDQKLTADRVRRLTVHAFTGLKAGSIEVKSLRVDR